MFASKHTTEGTGELFEHTAPILVKIEEDEYAKVKKTRTSQYIGVYHTKTNLGWSAYRWSKKDKKMVRNGYYKDEETAAHASDTLARKLKENGEHQNLNFPDDDVEVYHVEVQTSSNYIGVSYNAENSTWRAYRRKENKIIFNGSYKDEETAAHASDTLARKLMANGEHKFKLNFPDEGTEVNAEEKATSSQYIGVSYVERRSKWRAYRRSKHGRKIAYNGSYKDEETAAHASDTLARKLMANGEQEHKLNFPDDDTEVYPEEVFKNKRKRSNDIGVSQADETF